MSTELNRKSGSNSIRNILLVTAVVSIAVWVGWIWIHKSAVNNQDELIHTVTRGNLNVTVVEKGTLESSKNSEIKCKVRGYSVVTEVVEGGTYVSPGDVLVRLDTKRIDDAIGKHSTDAHVARATFERTKADVAKAEISIDAYLKGSYVSQLKALEQSLSIAEEQVTNAQRDLKDGVELFRKGYVNEFELKATRYSVTQANLELKIRQTAIEVLDKYTKEMELETLHGTLNSLHSKMKADTAGLAMDEGRRDRAIREHEYCVIKAERAGLVIYPSSAAWKDTPDVAQGVNVRHDQVLLLMPDLTKMQVKVGIHESLIERLETGLTAKVTLPEIELEGVVKSVAAIAQPAGWWTGNVVKYDTVIDLAGIEGLKPGMSAEVEILLAEYEDVLTVPVNAIVETDLHKFCWVKTVGGPERRTLVLGDSNDIFVIVKDGLNDGDDVILNPTRFVEDAKDEALRSLGRSIAGGDSDSDSVGSTSQDSGGYSEGFSEDSDATIATPNNAGAK